MNDPKGQQIPFFRVLSGSDYRDKENYLSRTFQACFLQSPVFAQCMLSLFWEKCRLSAPVPDASAWTCDYQPSPPLASRIKPDLCLRPLNDSNGEVANKPIYVESKVDANLKVEQLASYKESGTSILVAITKNWPEVSRERLARLKVNHLRWQDVARALSRLRGHKGKDRFLCDAFADFLEYSKMAYREDITLERLEQVRVLLRNIGTQGEKNFVPFDAFEIADSCLGVLKDALKIAQEKLPELNQCSRWGPGYYNECDEDGIKCHVLGFELYKKGKYDESKILCGLEMSARSPTTYWFVGHYGSNGTDDSDDAHVSTPIKKLMKNKVLDPYQLAQSIVDTVNELQPF